MGLFEPRKDHGNENDPIMINPRGAQVQVPQEKVPELLKKGFKLLDRGWRPEVEEPEVITRIVPREFEQLKEELEDKADLLEVTEIL